jgi:hypothetical protein
VLASSNGGSLVSFGGAQLAVWGDMPAAKGLYTDYVGTVSGLSIGGNAATATTSTNLTGGSQYAFPYQSASNTTTFLSAGTSGSVLITTGTFGPPTWLAQSSMTVGTATNIAGGAAGEIPFQTGSGATSFSAVGTAGQVLTSQGTGTPTWTTPTQVYPGAGIANSTGTAWGTSYSTTGSGTVVALATSPTFVTPTLGAATATSVTSGSFVANESITGSSTAGAYSYGTLAPASADINIFASYTSSVNNYNQIILQNTNSLGAASTDYVVNNNNSTATTYYGDYGMNSSGWSGVAGTNSFSAPNMVYLTSTSTDLAIGTTTSNSIRFVVGGGADALTINTSGNTVASGTVTAPELIASNGIVVNNRTISTSYTIPSGYSATSAGPVTISSGVTVTVPSGSKWVVL